MTAGRGHLVTFEGPEGAGKSTQLRILARRLEAEGHEVQCTREPGGGPLGDALRSILMGNDYGTIDRRTELLLMLAARSDHVERVIRPALAAGRVVLCDRFMDSSFAYQGAGRGIDPRTIDRLNGFATGGLVPHLTLLIDIDVAEGLRRATRPGTSPDRFEAETLAFHGRVREAFRARARALPSRFTVIDGSLPIEEVARLVGEAVETLLAGRGPARQGASA